MVTDGDGEGVVVAVADGVTDGDGQEEGLEEGDGSRAPVITSVEGGENRNSEEPSPSSPNELSPQQYTSQVVFSTTQV